jgi:hypothetical protein
MAKLLLVAFSTCGFPYPMFDVWSAEREGEKRKEKDPFYFRNLYSKQKILEID